MADTRDDTRAGAGSDILRRHSSGMEQSVSFLMFLGGSVLVLPILVILVTALKPGLFIKIYNWYLRRKMGLVVRYSSSGSYRFCYFSRGAPEDATPPLLLLHGFSANKDMWLPIIKFFPKEQYLVCVDMPGHEGTSRTGVEDYSIQGQVNRIHQFVLSIGLDKRPFHLVGTSMGGNVAGVYAACFPSHLSSVTLICPGGLDYPTDTEFITQLKEMEKNKQEGSIPLIPSTHRELEEMVRLCCYTPFTLPRQVLRALLDNRIPNNGFYKEVFREITGQQSRYLLQEKMHLITAPVHVIWGKQDKLLPRNQCVVCVDMPGHGGTSRIHGDDYTIQGQVTRIHQFVKSIGLDKRPFYLVGISMGGAVAGVYAADYSSFLTGVTLICPGPGLDSPVKNDIIGELKEGLGQKASIALIPTTPEEIRRMMSLFSCTERKVPSLIIRGILDIKRPNNVFYREVCEDLAKPQSVRLLQDKMHLISVPLQVIWGKNDMLVHHSGASLLKAAKPNCQVTLLDNCGHSVLLDKPKEAANLIMNFLSSEKMREQIMM
ncbi:monoacylglycerol lipase abhd6-B isoform X1 [Synchiropus splendidus]|uniref:monoacylglycerol lipase abhd6-B isoform X1 n=1 Tax=Synchiropus splendidus TaxID=270530 RepID=UPI00237E9B62|nr:monoacylglycerol lipase abhd6-B isoform X1 [Synchiropus splendidus]